ncbi:MAG: hypothetical protein JXQ29_13430 [Planctomycetes bacterium]|nr:hypothetical protein [Planctomycetota bacterium]
MSPIKLLVLLGAVAVVGIVAVVILVNRGGATPPQSESGTLAADAGAAPPAERPKADPAALRARYDELRTTALASGHADDWFALAAWCEDQGYEADQNRAEKLYKYIIHQVDPDHAGARRKLGYTRYEGELEKYAELKWLTDAEMKLVREAEEKARRHADRLDADPWYKAAESLVMEMRADKYLRPFDFEFTRYQPFLIAKQKMNPSTDAFKARILGEMLQAAAADFAETFKELGLKPLAEVQFRGAASVLPIVYFEDRLSFDRYHLSMGQEIPKGAAAYFMPSTNRIVYFEGEGEGSEKFNLNKMVHELVHQLVWFYTPSRTHCQLHFFQEGIAEFFSGTSRKAYTNEGGERSYEYTFREKLPQRMKHLKWAKQNHWFPYEELLQIPDKRALDAACQRKAGENEDERAACGALFYAQAWSLFYFLWHHKDGEYRPNLCRYVGLELDGKTGLRYFREAFDGVNLREVGRQWRVFVNSTGPFLGDV